MSNANHTCTRLNNNITYSFTSLISKNLNLNHVWVNVLPNAREFGIQKPRNFGS